MVQPRGRKVVAGAATAMLLLGCHPRPTPIRLDPIPMQKAIGIVNANIAKITGTLRASGSVDGFFTQADGRRRSFHLDGVLFYLAPSYFRFDLKKFGDRQLLLGSNETSYWVYNKQDDAFHCGRLGHPEDVPSNMPLRPQQMVAALGLSPISPANERLVPIQRIVDDYQQILFVGVDEHDRRVVEKEYWLDRSAPGLIGRVLFRDHNGVAEMESRLGDYRVLGLDGPMLPYTMVAEWPGQGVRLRFRVGTWRVEHRVKPDGPQFATPPACLGGEH